MRAKITMKRFGALAVAALMVIAFMLCGTACSVEPAPTTVPFTVSRVDETEPSSTMTEGQTEALETAKGYLNATWFSHDGLIEQLEFDGYSHDDAMYAVNHCGADWFEQALVAANAYLDYSAFSYAGVVDILESNRFTHEQAVYGADNCGADWFAQTTKAAKEYLSATEMTRDQLLVQLVYDGFTQEQADYGADQNEAE